MLCVHPKDTPATFIYIRHAMMSISVVTTVLCVYIVKKSTTVTRVYANLLVLLVIGSFSVDLFVQWVFDPAFISPLMCIYRRAPLLGIVPIRGGACAAILPPQSRYKFSSTKQIAFLATLSIPFGSLGATFQMARVDARNHPTYNASLGADWDEAVLGRTDCYVNTQHVPYGILVGLIVLFTLTFIIGIARHTLLTLKEMKQISQKTQDLHRVLLRSLVAQALVPVVFVILPFGFLLLVNVFFYNYAPEIMNNFAFDLTDFVILTISFHATAHSTTVLATTPAFRDTLYKMFTCIRKTTPQLISPTSVHSAFTT